MLILPIVCFIIGISIYTAVTVYKEEKSIGFSIFMFFISSTMSSFTFGVLFLIITEFTKIEVSEFREIPIYSLERDINVSGRFFLGTGTIKTETVYYSYMQVGENEYKLYNFNTDDSTLVLQDIKPPYIRIEFIYEYSELSEKWFNFNKILTNKRIYKFFVPSTTIIREYKG